MTTKSSNLKAYVDWLKREGYQPSTIAVSIRHLNSLERLPITTDDDYRIPHVRRYMRYCSATRRHPLGKSFYKKMLDKGLGPSKIIDKPGGRIKEKLTRQQWDRLRKYLMRRGDDTSYLLLAYMDSPLRIKEFLDLPVQNVDASLVRGAQAREWLSKHTQGNPRLFRIICSTPRCAYARLRRHLIDIGHKHRIEVDLDTLYKSYHAGFSQDEDEEEVKAEVA